MNLAARQNGSADPAGRATRRFGIAVLGSAILITGLAFTVYIRDPETTLQPSVVHGSTFFVKAAEEEAVAPRTRTLLDAFVEALQREDEAALRSVYPRMTEKDAHVLRALRRRLGDGTALRATSVRLKSATPAEIQVEFAVVSSSEKPEEMRLPFAATIRKIDGAWRIAELH